jgi:hypothetical protein
MLSLDLDPFDPNCQACAEAHCEPEYTACLTDWSFALDRPPAALVEPM